MNPQDPKIGQSKSTDTTPHGTGTPPMTEGGGLEDEATQTLSLDELGITPVEPTKVQPAPKPASGETPAAKPAAPAPPAAPEAAQPPPAKAEPPAATKPAATPEATQRLDAPGEKTQVERTARLDEAIAAGLATPGVEKTIPPEPDDEPELPYSLQPTQIESETPQASKSTRQRRVLSWWAWLLIGISAGLIAQVWLYFHNWKVTAEAASPTVEALKVAPRAGLTPPGAWELIGREFIGKDSNNQPWLFDPETSGLTMAQSPLPQDVQLGSISIVGRPPLERHTRLAWIEKSSGANTLVVKDFDFEDATQEADRSEPGSTQQYLIAPVAGVADPELTHAQTADPGLGTLLVVAGSDGSLGAWSAVQPKDQATSQGLLRQVWNLKLEGAPVAAPKAWIDLRGAEPRTWLMAPTATGLALVDAVAGEVVETQAWNPEINAGRKLAMVPMRQGDRGWGWFGSNGEQAYQWLFSADGKIHLSPVTMPAVGTNNNGEAPQVMTFPDPDSQGNDQWLVKSDGGEAVWMNFNQVIKQGVGVEKALSRTEVGGRLAAVDADGDGYQDLIGIGEILLWHRMGPADAENDWDTVEWVDVKNFKAVNSDVYWRLAETGLVGVYFDKNWTPMQVTLPVAMGTDYIKVLQFDWKRRQGQ